MYRNLLVTAHPKARQVKARGFEEGHREKPGWCIVSLMLINHTTRRAPFRKSTPIGSPSENPFAQPVCATLAP
jgi:hypothetical protein